MGMQIIHIAHAGKLSNHYCKRRQESARYTSACCSATGMVYQTGQLQVIGENGVLVDENG